MADMSCIDHIETFIFIIISKSSLVICLFLTSQASNHCQIVKVCKTFSYFFLQFSQIL